MADKLSRTIQRFQAKIDSGSFYEAHQTLRTITNRYVKSKNYQEASDLLYQGASILIKNKEYASGSDLISYLIQVYDEQGITTDNKDAKLKLIDLISGLPDSDPLLFDLAKQSITFSQKCPQVAKFGDNDLHHLFGSKLLRFIETNEELDDGHRGKYFAVVELHLILGTFESVPLYVNYLILCAQANPDVDPGVFLSRAVINYAYLKNIKFVQDANDLFVKSIEGGEALDEITYFEKYPLLNFLQLLVVTLQKEGTSNSQKFLKLYDHYKPTFSQYGITGSIDYLGLLYFNLKLGNANQQGNMLANLMGSLFK